MVNSREDKLLFKARLLRLSHWNWPMSFSQFWDQMAGYVKQVVKDEFGGVQMEEEFYA